LLIIREGKSDRRAANRVLRAGGRLRRKCPPPTAETDAFFIAKDHAGLSLAYV
jgi:hypothetical protein